ncbi:sugar transferase [Streptomyces sp. NPDC048560]|uniref:sugar transferase n=1 Tax=Streptomyces sp. NPDC048560 TaxID=3155488 RepID=UPI003438DB27
MQNPKRTAVRTRGHTPSRTATSSATSAATRAAALSRTAGRGITHTAGRAAGRLTAKRLVDLLLGAALLALASPALAVGALALAVRRPAGGVLLREQRTGLDGRIFELRSLRTRRWRLDLLSRLPHVVRGELSLVGPAPLAPGDPRTAGPGARRWRQELRPGLTGLAQVRARSGMPWDEPALLDQHYAEHHWVGLDLAILAEAVRLPLRAILHAALRALPHRRPRAGKGYLSDADHRLPGYSVAE